MGEKLDRFFSSRPVVWGSGITFLVGAIWTVVGLVREVPLSTLSYAALFIGALSLVLIAVNNLHPLASAPAEDRPASAPALVERIEALAEELMGFSAERESSKPDLFPSGNWDTQRQLSDRHRTQTKVQFQRRYSARIASVIAEAERAGVGVPEDFKIGYPMLAGATPVHDIASQLLDIASHLR